MKALPLIAIWFLLLASLFELTGCAQLSSGSFGLASAAVTVPCAGGGSASYNAPFGIALGTITATCTPGPNGGTVASIQTDNSVQIADIISQLIGLGLLSAAPAAKEQPPQGQLEPNGYWL